MMSENGIGFLNTIGSGSTPSVPVVPPRSMASFSRKPRCLANGMISTPGVSFDL